MGKIKIRGKKVMVVVVMVMIMVIMNIMNVYGEKSKGVVIEEREDGSKVVEINLSEIKEEELPEEYRGEVILEAPILTVDKADKKTGKTPPGTFIAGEANQICDYDVEIDEKGDIYILDVCNRRITKFSGKGKLLKIIPVRHAYTTDEEGVIEDYKNDIAIWRGRIYILNKPKREIEEIGEGGEIKRRIKVKREGDIEDIEDIEGEIEVDEEGRLYVGDMMWEEGKWRKRGRRKKIEEGKVIIKKENEQILQVNNKISFKFVSNERIFWSTLEFIDKNGNMYIMITRKKIDDLLKIDKNGKLLSRIDFRKFWWSKECKKNIMPLLPSIERSMIWKDRGDLFLLQVESCRKKCKECEGILRVIKLYTTRGR